MLIHNVLDDNNLLLAFPFNIALLDLNSGALTVELLLCDSPNLCNLHQDKSQNLFSIDP